jgi:diguanylate cyclase (GGDEF)-like protein/PAS domain S-box-containing protein
LYWGGEEQGMDPSNHDKQSLGNGASGGHGDTHANGGPPKGDGWLGSVLKSSSEVVKVVEPDGTLRYASPAFGRVFGYDPGESVGTMNVLDYVHPDDLPRLLEETEEALSKGGIVTNRAEYRFRHKDGSWRWVESVGTFLLDDPQVGGVVVNARDVTERKAAEEALRRSEGALGESERRFASVVSNAHAYAYRCLNEPGWPNEYVSDYALELTGYPPEDLLMGGKVQLGDLIVEEDRERVWEQVQEALAENRGFELEYAIRRRDGQIRHVHEYGEGVWGEDGEVVALEGLVYDVTGRRQAEEALKEAEERYRTLVERVPAIVYVQEPGEPSRTTYVSPQNEAILGYAPEECLADPDHWVKILHPDDRERVLEEDGHINETDDSFAMEYRQFAKDGSVVWLRDEATLVRGEGGEPLYWLGVQTDVTERREAEEALKRSEASLVESQRIAHLGTWEWDLLTGEVWWSEETYRIHGQYPGEGMSLLQIVEEAFFPEDLPQHKSKIDEAISGPSGRYDFEHRLRKPDGGVRWVHGQAEVVRDGEGRPCRMLGTVHDVTERRMAEAKLQEAEASYRSLVERVPVAIYRQEVEHDGAVSYISPQIEAITGYAPEEYDDPEFWIRTMHPDDRRRVLDEDARTDRTGEPFRVEFRKFARDGRLVWLRDEAVLVRDEAGEPLYWQGVVSDITERKALEERLEHQALHDPLTGLPNRRLFVNRLGQAVRRTRRRKGSKTAVLFMDLDGFKVVNDSLGHDVGDLLLRVVAQRLGRCLRPEDLLARFGGDEFVVLLEDVESPEEAVRVAERITGELRRPFLLEGRELFVAASIGISLGDARTHDPEGLLREADTAMYRAKEGGGGFGVFDPAMHERALGRLDLENGLRRAVERGEFVVHYQPIVRLDDGRVPAVEALVRWEHPERGLLNPDEFVPVAEESGLVVPMGVAVLEEACRRAKAWQEAHPQMPPLVVSVNISARQLARPDLAETVEEVLGMTGFEGNCLFLDVTETAYVSALAGDAGSLGRLREMGVRISIDDFGTGYSSLSYLKRLPAHTIKVDKSFVRGLGEDVGDTMIVRMVVELAHTLGMEVVAEGVETEQQAALLAELGCDFAQGYLFSKPLPPEEVPGFLAG